MDHKRHTLTSIMEAMRYFVSTGVLGMTALMLPMWVLADQGSTSFQVSLRIVARPPAPDLRQQVISAALPGNPPYSMLNDRVMTQQKSGVQFTMLTTEY